MGLPLSGPCGTPAWCTGGVVGTELIRAHMRNLSCPPQKKKQMFVLVHMKQTLECNRTLNKIPVERRRNPLGSSSVQSNRDQTPKLGSMCTRAACTTAEGAATTLTRFQLSLWQETRTNRHLAKNGIPGSPIHKESYPSKTQGRNMRHAYGMYSSGLVSGTGRW